MPTLLAQAEPSAPMQFSALPYTDEEMNDAAYSVDLPSSKATVLCLAAKTLGVGSNSCGPRPLPQYLVQSDATFFSYSLRLLPRDVANLSAVAREAAPARPAHPVLAAIDGGKNIANNSHGRDYFL